MIAFRYTKTDGAEYISHLDLLRHIDRTLRRAGIKVEYSQGFHKHPRIFMGNPLALGVRSVSEYCTIDCGFTGDFKEAFDGHSPDGIKCLAWKAVQNNPNFAQSIKACRYETEGLNGFDPEEGHVPAEHSVVEQVHVGIVEAGQHRGPLQVHFFVPLLVQGLLVRSQKHDLAVLSADGLVAVHGPVHGCNCAIVAKFSHIHLPFLPLFCPLNMQAQYQLDQRA